ncbi:retrovirus-related pol polyprotein from transposon TNT 1-94 [Tanacetum coccineum]
MDQVTKHKSMQGTNDHKRKFDDRRNTTNNNNYPNNRINNYQNSHSNRNNDYRQQQNRRQTIRSYAATPTKNSRYTGSLPLCQTCNRVGHLTRNCKNKGPATRSNQQPVSVICHVCKEKGHYNYQCSKVNNSAHGKAYLLRDKNAHRDPNVVTAKKIEKSHDPLALVAHTGSSSRQTSSYYVKRPTSVVDYDDEYQQDDVHNNSEDPLVSTINQAIIQGDKVNIQNRNYGNSGRNSRRAYVQEEVVEGMNAPKETGNVKGLFELRLQEILQLFNATTVVEKDIMLGINDFLFADASRMEEIEELSANICLMSKIQPADNTSDAGPSYDSAFISEVQSSSINENKEQMYPTHTKIINSTIGDDQIDSNIIFDSPNGNVNSGSVENDTHVPDLCALEQFSLDMISGRMFMLGPKPLSVYDQQLKQVLGYSNPYTLKQAISQCPKLYLASSLGNSKISLNVRDTEDTLDDASKSQQKRDIKEMKDVFESTESELCELEKQNDFLKDQLLEVSLKHEVELSVLLNHECVDNSLHAEIEQIKKKSIEIQEGLQARIKILEKDVQRCEKQSVDFELKLQHEKEKHK